MSCWCANLGILSVVYEESPAGLGFYRRSIFKHFAMFISQISCELSPNGKLSEEQSAKTRCDLRLSWILSYPKSSKLALCRLSITVAYIWRFAVAGDYIFVSNAFVMWRLVMMGRWVLVGWDWLVEACAICLIMPWIWLCPPTFLHRYVHGCPPSLYEGTHIQIQLEPELCQHGLA